MAPGERRLLLSLVFLLPLAGLSLRLAGVRRTYTWMQRFTPVRAQDPTARDLDQVRLAVRLVAATARRMPYPVSCLRRSLCLWWVLARRGLYPRLVIGVSRPEGGFAAHAWVEWQGLVVNDDPGVRERYVPVDWNGSDRLGEAPGC